MLKTRIIGWVVVIGLAAAAGADAGAGGARVTVRHAGLPSRPAVFDVGDTIEVLVLAHGIRGGTALGKATAPETAAPAPSCEPLPGVATHLPPGTRLTARWVDSYGRLVAETGTVVDPQGGAVFRIPVRACVSTGNWMHVLAGEIAVAAPTLFGCAPQFTRPLRDWYVFPWSQYPAGTGDTLRSVGVNGGMAYRNQDFSTLVVNDLRFYVDQMARPLFAPYTHGRQTFRTMWEGFLTAWRERGVVDRSLLVRDPCLSDPATLDRIRAMMKEHVAPHAPYKPVWYNIQDEGGMAMQNQKNAFCQGPFCLAGLRTWLKEQYPSLEALNEAWGTAFAAWDAVVPFTDYELRVREKDVPLHQRRYGGFCDHRAFMDRVMTAALAEARRAGRQADPTGLFGMTGTQGPSPWPAFDYSLIPTAVDIAHYYDYNNAIELARSFHPRHGSRLFPYPGWSRGHVRVREDWYYLFHGLGATGIWDQAHELLDADGRPTPKVLAFKDTWLELQRGIGRLIINARRDNDPIAVYFSQPSLRVREMLSDDPLAQDATWAWDDTGVIRALEDLGFQYDFVAYNEVEAGLLEKGAYRLLFMLNTLAVSDQEAAAIAAWVKAGGVLVYDQRLGLFDEHGRGRNRPALAGLMTDTQAHRKDACVRLEGSMSRALAAYPRERIVGGDESRPVRDFLTAVLKTAKLAPRVTVHDRSGRPAEAVEVIQFTDGPARYVALLRNPGNDGRLNRTLKGAMDTCFSEPLPVTVTLDRTAHLYNVRSGEYLGRTDRDAPTIQPWSPTVYALLPYRVTEIDVTAPETAKPGEIVTVLCEVKADDTDAAAMRTACLVPCHHGDTECTETQDPQISQIDADSAGDGFCSNVNRRNPRNLRIIPLPTPCSPCLGGEFSFGEPLRGVARHVLRVDVIGPDGALRTYYSRNLDTEAGRAAMTIPFALNDPPGLWRLRVRDVATGITADHAVRLEYGVSAAPPSRAPRRDA